MLIINGIKYDGEVVDNTLIIRCNVEYLKEIYPMPGTDIICSFNGVTNKLAVIGLNYQSREGDSATIHLSTRRRG